MSDERIVDALLALYAEEDAPKTRFDRGLFFSFLDDARRVLNLDFLKPGYRKEDVCELVDGMRKKLAQILKDRKEEPEGKVRFFLEELPKARRLLLSSARAILEGDPASLSLQEVIFCYPGYYAILTYRIANILVRMGLPFLARMASEDAHRSTGIDINPGATIGESFFIDHGTGIVIGETAVIGDRVKLYQGVTLGALSLKDGHKLSGKKRHPTIENDCTIYSNATILGGETVIGHDTTIGANTYLLSSVEPHSRVLLTDSGVRIFRKE